jgi:hypothetical protein
MSDKPSFSGPNKPSAEEIKREILKKLDEVDLEALSDLTDSTQSEESPDRAEWSRVIWTVWRR